MSQPLDSSSRAAGIPIGIRAHLAHAALQVLAQDAGVDILHIKGPAVHPRIGRALTHSTDADVLVRPEQVKLYVKALLDHGWRHNTSFETGSAFEHAATFFHPTWGYVDLHRRYPGITAPKAFNNLWARRIHQMLGGVRCATPALIDQRLILLLHVARNSSGTSDPDYALVWATLDECAQADLRRRARELGAQVGLAAALGELDQYRQDPTHDLWMMFSTGEGGRLDEWKARFKAANGPLAKARIVGRALLVNTDHLTMRLGHEPTPAEVRQEYVERYRAALREGMDKVKRKL